MRPWVALRWVTVATALLLLFLSGCDSEPAHDPVDLGSDAAQDAPAEVVEVVEDQADLEADTASFTVKEGCNPIGAPTDCLLPFPSDVFLADDASTPTGHRVVLGDASPVWANRPKDFSTTEVWDGYSLLPTILAVFPEGVDPSLLIAHSDPAASLDLSGTTLLLAADGTPVPHFAELDLMADDPDDQALFIRPLQRLAPETRYVVAIRDLRSPSGALLQAPEGFARLRDKNVADQPALSALAEHTESAVFAPLAAAGIDRSSLQLAWEFTTRSEVGIQSDLLAVREAALTSFQSVSPEAFDVVQTVFDGDPNDAFQLDFEMSAPLFLESGEPGARLVRTAAGLPLANGSVRVPVEVIVPRCLIDDPSRRPGRVVQFGHGFFGGRDEINEQWLGAFANETGTILIAADWWGLSDRDSTGLVEAIINDPLTMFGFVDRLHQAMVNQLALSAFIRGNLSQIPELTVDGQLLFDPAQHTFYGISLGSILGKLYFALEPDIERAAFSVGGAAFSFIMSRSAAFGALTLVLDSVMRGGRLELHKFFAVSQLSLDRIDAINYAPLLLQNRLDGSTDRRILLQLGLGDPSVPGLSEHLFARSAGVPLAEPAVRAVPLLDVAPLPIAGSALVEFDFQTPPPLPGEQVQVMPANGVHEAVRLSALGQVQVDHFLDTGEVIQTCDGACDPD